MSKILVDNDSLQTIIHQVLKRFADGQPNLASEVTCELITNAILAGINQYNHPWDDVSCHDCRVEFMERPKADDGPANNLSVKLLAMAVNVDHYGLHQNFKCGYCNATKYLTRINSRVACKDHVKDALKDVVDGIQGSISRLTFDFMPAVDLPLPDPPD